jgi:acyl-coenzyme A synthetase/AMP-(fatty) acid ligase
VEIDRRLSESGAPNDAPIALIARNRPQLLAAVLALFRAGRSIQMVHAFQQPAGIAKDLERLRPAVIVADEADMSEDVRHAASRIGAAAIMLTKTSVLPVPGLATVVASKDFAAFPHPQVMVLTSGTTGAPKHFPLTYDTLDRYFLSDAWSGREPPPSLAYYPLGNFGGVYSIIPALLIGAPIELLDRFSVEAWHAFILTHRPRRMGIPAVAVQMVLQAEFSRDDFGSIEYFMTGAGPVDTGVHRAFEERYGAPLLLAYGATEFGGSIASMTAELHREWGKAKFGSVGRVVPGAQLRIRHPDTGEILPPGEVGLVEAVSPAVGDDWIRTTDLATIDEDGFVYHRGRADGAIIRGGFKVLPETIEAALLLHPAVTAAAVTGLPDPRLSQVPAAVVVTRPGMERPSFDELEHHLRQHLLATHIPVHWRYADELPRMLTMKVDRRAVADMFAAPGSENDFAGGQRPQHA